MTEVRNGRSPDTTVMNSTQKEIHAKMSEEVELRRP